VITAPGKRILHAIRYIGGGISDLLFPAVCAGCGAPSLAADLLCDSCARLLLSMVSLPYCPRCGATIGPNIPIREDGCSACPSTLPRFAEVVRLGPYAHPLRSVIRQLKYHRREEMLRRLGQLLVEAICAKVDTETLDVVLPVPMHWRRRLVRGTDHARALGRQIAKLLDLPLGDELVRTRHTPPQVNLPRTRRIEIVRGAFGLRARRSIEGTHVLLVDDVTTTGATANEATRTLLSGGASRVTLAVVAKAEPPTAYGAHGV
jgi:ComF family protein